MKEDKKVSLSLPVFKDIKGLIKTSFVDWDGLVSSVLFLPHCNFRCPFCQNWILVEEPEKMEDVPWEEVEEFLKKKKGWIDGVVLTGGEPTLYPALFPLTQRIKELGLKVKLDTNGSHSQTMRKLVEASLIDYIAMDVKAPLDERYEKASGVKVDLFALRESIEFLLEDKVDYEFRTTLVPSIVGEEEIKDIGKEIKGAKRWVLQEFVPHSARNEELRRVRPYKREDAERLLSLGRDYVRNISYRGKWR